MRRDEITDAPPPLAGARVLVVEDDFVVRLEIETVLGRAGASVRGCGSVAQALAAIDTAKFDVAVLDVRLCRETITPVARKLEQIGTPFLFYTGTEQTATLEWPEARVIAKPAAPAVLIDAVLEALRRSAV
jgi:DNA-binding response OmpR family regulator